jgi:hypothetical protein
MKRMDEIEQYWPATKAARILGLSLVSLRELAETGRIDCYMTPGGKYRYDVRGFLSKAKAATRARLDRKAKAKSRCTIAISDNSPVLPGIADADKANEVGV